jgi:hypothetical protein
VPSLASPRRPEFLRPQSRLENCSGARACKRSFSRFDRVSSRTFERPLSRCSNNGSEPIAPSNGGFQRLECRTPFGRVQSDTALRLTRRIQLGSRPSVTSCAPTRSARSAGPRPLSRSGRLHPDRRSQVGRQAISRPPGSRRLRTHNCCREQSNRPQAAVSDAATPAHLWTGTFDVNAGAPVPLTGSRPLDSSDAPLSRERASGKPLRRRHSQGCFKTSFNFSNNLAAHVTTHRCLARLSR